MSELTGSLALTVERRSAVAVDAAADTPGQVRSIITAQAHEGSLRILRPFYPDESGQPSVTIVNTGGGYLGGDRYRLQATLGRDASLHLSTQAATKVYRTPQGPARLEQRYDLGAQARLEVTPDSLIAYRGASYEQLTEVQMDPTASLVLTDVVTQGWSENGAAFAFDRLSMRTRVHCGGELLLTDTLFLDPAAGGKSQLMLGGFTNLGTLIAVDPRLDSEAFQALRAHLRVRELDPSVVLAAMTMLDRPGFMLRILTHSTQQTEALIHAAVDWMRVHWEAQAPMKLRKY